MASRGQPKLRRLPSAVKFGVPLVLFCVAGYVGLSTVGLNARVLQLFPGGFTGYRSPLVFAGFVP
jgi:hypothetical protein